MSGQNDIVKRFTVHGCSGSHAESYFGREMHSSPYLQGDIYRGTEGDIVADAQSEAFEAVMEANTGKGTRTTGEIEYLQSIAGELASHANERS